MESDITALNSDGGPRAEIFVPGQSKTEIIPAANQLDWPARTKMTSRRIGAFFVDFVMASSLSFILLGLPFCASMAFSIWEPTPTSPGPTAFSQFVANLLQISAVLAFFNQAFFYTAFGESSLRQATPGKILMGLKTLDKNGNRQTFSGVLRRSSGRYFFIFVVCAVSYALVSFAAEFIPSLQMEELRIVLRTSIVAASFLLCLVTDKEQNLYDMLTGRQVTADDTTSWAARWQGFRREVSEIIQTLNPFSRCRKISEQLGGLPGTLALILAIWTYVGLAAGLIFISFCSVICLSMFEVESGIAAEAKHQSSDAARHFKKALALSPGIAIIYQNYYVFNDNLDPAKQENACARLLAIRGNAQDFLLRARLRAKEQQYTDAENDYKQALSGLHGNLDLTETADADTELNMLRLESEAAKASPKAVLPMHSKEPTSPF